MITYLWPYKIGSESAKSLADSLGVLRISGSKKIKRNRLVVNWGNSQSLPELEDSTIVNHPNNVASAVNKMEMFRLLSDAGVATVAYSESRRHVENNWRTEDSIIYARQLVDSYGGKGIIIIKAEDAMVDAPFYTLGFMSAHEYRVHVAGGKIIDYTKKKRRAGIETNEYIRNSNGGWVFCRDGVTLPYQVADLALRATEALGLDFCAVDILYKKKDNMAKVLEVNTAPGLEGTTLARYVDYFKKEILCL